MQERREMFVLAIIGTKASGKTTVAEHIISGLTKVGYRVAAIKHIHHEFTIDSRGRDTWRMGRAGAMTVIGVSPKETFVIKKNYDQPKDTEGLLSLLHDERADVVVFEGFSEVVGNLQDIPKILTAKSKKELEQILKRTLPPILAITGIIAKEKGMSIEHVAPVLDLEKGGDRLLKVVQEAAEKTLRRE